MNPYHKEAKAEFIMHLMDELGMSYEEAKEKAEQSLLRKENLEDDN